MMTWIGLLKLFSPTILSSLIQKHGRRKITPSHHYYSSSEEYCHKYKLQFKVIYNALQKIAEEKVQRI